MLEIVLSKGRLMALAMALLFGLSSGMATADVVDFRVDPDTIDSNMDGFITGSEFQPVGSDGTVFEIGLCSPYQATFPECIPEDSSGSDTITIPAGITSAEWNFPGDFWGEISFKIYAPSGNLVADYSAGSPAGSIALNLCNE